MKHTEDSRNLITEEDQMQNSSKTPASSSEGRGLESQSPRPRLNVELLKAVRDKIATAPGAYDQSVYARLSHAAPCGTAACVAGWACVLSGKMDTSELMRREQAGGEWFKSIESTAREVLSLNKLEADTLFTESPEGDGDEYDDEVSGGWPEPFCDEWRDASRGELPRIAVAYLNHIIETGKVLE